MLEITTDKDLDVVVKQGTPNIFGVKFELLGGRRLHVYIEGKSLVVMSPEKDTPVLAVEIGNHVILEPANK